jgi:hypothetical protein
LGHLKPLEVFRVDSSEVADSDRTSRGSPLCLLRNLDRRRRGPTSRPIPRGDLYARCQSMRCFVRRLTITVCAYPAPFRGLGPSRAALFLRSDFSNSMGRFQLFRRHVTLFDDEIAQCFRGPGGFRRVLFLARICLRKRKRNAQKEFFHWCLFGDRITRDGVPVGEDPWPVRTIREKQTRRRSISEDNAAKGSPDLLRMVSLLFHES